MAKVLVSGTTIVTFTDAAGTIRSMGAYIDSMSNIGRALQDVDVTNFADTAERFIAGIEVSPVITVNGPFEQTGTIGPDPVFVLLVGSSTTMVFNPVGTAAGARRYTIVGTATKFDVIANVKERVNYVFEFRKDGTVTVGTV